ncbi:MAG: bifunctional tetrahydrofolate synthase/dihydrofolate synthase [Colwellia sp.]
MTENTPSDLTIEKNLDKWLSYIENIHNQEIDLGLKRISEVARRLEINLNFAEVITVAGTNGKGTTCAFLENTLLSNQLSVAVYSSPHIQNFNERLRLNKKDVQSQSFIEAFELIEEVRGDISLSYYEFTTLAAFVVLMQSKPDVIILEVGLGGRLDATNIIDADIAVITTIDLDHQAFLGNTRELIGAEKAGIMRSNQYIVVGDNSPPASVLKKAQTVYPIKDDFINQVKVKNKVFFNTQLAIDNVDSKAVWNWVYKDERNNTEHVIEGLKQTHIPQDNVATALMVLWHLKSKYQLLLNTESINENIDRTRVPGRTEIFPLTCAIHRDNKANIHLNSDVMLDVAHNPQASRYLAGKIKSLLKQKQYSKVNAVVGMLVDKDISATLSALSDVIDKWYIAPTKAPRAADIEMLKSKLPNEIKSFNCFDNISQAFKIANTDIQSDELLLVFGSFFTVAEVRALLVDQSE